MRDLNDLGTLDLISGRLLLGYARVSTEDQDLTNQRAELHAAGCTRIFSEKSPAPGVTGLSWSGCSITCAPATWGPSPGWTA